MRSAADSSGVNATPPSPAFAAGAGLRCNPVVISYTSVSRPYGVGVPGSSMRGENGLPAASAAAAVLITPTAVAAGSGGSVVLAAVSLACLLSSSVIAAALSFGFGIVPFLPSRASCIACESIPS